MTPFLRKLLGQNWLLLLIMLALAVFGVVAIYSATSTRSDPYAADFWREQANWVAVGVFAFMLTSLVHYRWVRWGALPIWYLAGIVFLILTKFMGVKVYGARSWLHLGPINFQPAQLAVVAGIMVLALFLTQFRQMHPARHCLPATGDGPCAERFTNTNPSHTSARTGLSGNSSRRNPGDPSMCGAPINRPS